MHAILGASDSCIATHPSDMCVALAALDATVHVQGAGGERTIPMNEFHHLPGDTPHVETSLGRRRIDHGDSPSPARVRETLAVSESSRPRQLRIRFGERGGGAWKPSDGVIRNVRLALGGVAHKPWRAYKAEKTMIGAKASQGNF